MMRIFQVSTGLALFLAGALVTVVQAQSACTIYTSTDIPVALPNQVASISSSLVATSPGLISDLNVTVDMAHSWTGDLTMTLINQQTNTSVVILDKPGVPASEWGCQNSDILATFDDDGTLDSETSCAATPPAIAGNFQPSSPLSAFNQEQAAGSWVLQIDDAFISADPGALNAWSIEICTDGVGNQAPVLSDPGTQTNQIYDVVNLALVVSDADAGDVLSFSASGLPGGLTIDANSGLISGVVDVVGVYNVTLTVSDGNGGSASRSVQWIVQAQNACTIYTSTDIPVVLPNQVASISSSLVASSPGLISDLNVTVDMAHSWPGDLTMTLVNQQTNTSVVILDKPGVPASEWGCQNSDILATFDDDGTLDSETSCAATPPAIAGNFQPSSPLSAFNQEQAAGNWVLQIDDAFVSADPGALNAWSMEICTDSVGNQAPIADAGVDQTLSDSDSNGVESVLLDASASVDGDGTILSYVWTSDTATVIPNGVSPTANFAVGEHLVTLTVTDNDGATDTDTLLIAVNALPNQLPTANAGPDQSVTDIDDSGAELVNLDAGLSHDTDGVITSFVWSSNTGVTIPSGETSTANFPVGLHHVTLTVTDDDGATATDTMNILVEFGPNPPPNQPPLADAGADQNVVDIDDDGSEIVDLSAFASFDSDGVIVSYAWSSDSGVVIANGLNTSASFPPGVHTVTLSITDDDGAIASDSLIVTVTEAPNNAPVLSDPGTQTNQVNDLVNLALVASDADAGDVLSFSASGLPGGLTIDANSGLISGVVDVVGVYNVTLTVSDGNGGSASRNVQWIVQAQNACTIYTSTDIPVVLPNQVASISSSLVASSPGLISDLNVTVDMAHSWPGDLSMTLTNQQTNTSVVILDKPGVPASEWGCQNSDILATFDDDGTLDSETSCAATPPAIAGNFQPSSPLSAFNQEQAAGSWVLQIDDAFVSADPGALNAWSMEICTDSVGNQAPIVNAGADFSAYVGQSLPLPGTVFDDAVTLPLTVEWGFVNGITFTDASDPATTATFESVGQFNLVLSADDTEFFVNDTVVVTVSIPINQPPVVDAGVNFTALVGVPVQLDGSVVDDGLALPLTIDWSSLSGVSYVDPADPGTAVTFDTPGTYPLVLTASDPEFVASDTVVVNVIENSPRIMPLGDSITHGYGYWSYRHRLSDLLLDQQCVFDFVGSENGPSSGPGGTGVFDRDHEGHSGWRTDEIEISLPGWIADNEADWVLIHLGTNDILQGEPVQQAAQNLSDIIDILRAQNSSIGILLAQIIPIREEHESDVIALNQAIASLVASKTQPGVSPVLLVDQYTGFDSDTMNRDGIHPNLSGEDFMANRWSEVLLPEIQGACN